MRHLRDVLGSGQPSGAVSYAAVVQGKLTVSDLKVGVILSGGNLDLDVPPWRESEPSPVKGHGFL